MSGKVILSFLCATVLAGCLWWSTTKTQPQLAELDQRQQLQQQEQKFASAIAKNVQTYKSQLVRYSQQTSVLNILRRLKKDRRKRDRYKKAHEALRQEQSLLTRSGQQSLRLYSAGGHLLHDTRRVLSRFEPQTSWRTLSVLPTRPGEQARLALLTIDQKLVLASGQSLYQGKEALGHFLLITPITQSFVNNLREMTATRIPFVLFDQERSRGGVVPKSLQIYTQRWLATQRPLLQGRIAQQQSVQQLSLRWGNETYAALSAPFPVAQTGQSLGYTIFHKYQPPTSPALYRHPQLPWVAVGLLGLIALLSLSMLLQRSTPLPAVSHATQQPPTAKEAVAPVFEIPILQFDPTALGTSQTDAQPNLLLAAPALDVLQASPTSPSPVSPAPVAQKAPIQAPTATKSTPPPPPSLEATVDTSADSPCHTPTAQQHLQQKLVAPTVPRENTPSINRQTMMYESISREIAQAHLAKLETKEAESPATDPNHPWQTVYRRYLDLREQCGESTSHVHFDKFCKQLEAQREQILHKYDCKDVRFDVYVKENQTSLKATPIT